MLESFRPTSGRFKVGHIVLRTQGGTNQGLAADLLGDLPMHTISH